MLKASLKGCGVVFEHYDMPETSTGSGVYEGSGAKAAWFRDTEGNILALVESNF